MSLGRIILPLFPGLRSILGSLDRIISIIFSIYFPFVSHSGFFGPHDFIFIFHLSPAIVVHIYLPLWALWATCFYIFSHLSPTLISHSGHFGPHNFTLVSHACLPYLSPTLGAPDHVILYFFPTCLPLWALWAACFLHLSPACFPHLSPTLDALDRMNLQ